MSRHEFPGHTGATRVAAGYDRPLETFFVQVYKPHPTMEGEDFTFIWRGTDLREITVAAKAIEIAAPWSDLPTDLSRTLETDRLMTLGHSDGEHQAMMKRRLFPDR